MTAVLVYKTSSPKAIDWYRDVVARDTVVRDKRRVYTDQLTSEFGEVGKRYEHDSEHIDHRPLMRNSSNQITGLMCRSGEKPPKGSGWRLDAQTGFWKPDLRTNKGKELEAELETLSGVNMLNELYEIGAAGMAFVPGSLYRPGVTFRDETGELFVYWGSKDCEDEMLAASAKVPDVEWAVVPLSEWHAWREQVEA